MRKNIVVSMESHPELYERVGVKLGLEFSGEDMVTIDADNKTICRFPMVDNEQPIQLTDNDPIWNSLTKDRGVCDKIGKVINTDRVRITVDVEVDVAIKTNHVIKVEHESHTFFFTVKEILIGALEGIKTSTQLNCELIGVFGNTGSPLDRNFNFDALLDTDVYYVTNFMSYFKYK